MLVEVGIDQWILGEDENREGRSDDSRETYCKIGHIISCESNQHGTEIAFVCMN